MIYFKRLLLILLFSTSLSAKPEFKPHMLNHQNRGCPANSECGQAMGSLRKSWMDTLKKSSSLSPSRKVSLLEAFRQKNGIPLSFWAKANMPLPKESILYDSHCKQHRPEGKSIILQGETFAKDYNALSKSPHIQTKKIYLKTKTQILTFQVPREDAPLFSSNNSLYYLKEEDGQYYGLLLSADGSLKITSQKASTHSTDEIDCPDELVRLFNQEEKLIPNLYRGSYCRTLWDEKKKVYQTALIGWSCN